MATLLPPTWVALFSLALLTIGMLGVVLNRRNVIVLLMSIELMLLAVNTQFLGASAMWHNLDGQVLASFVLAVAAAESAIGLAILVLLFRHHRSVDIDDFQQLKG